MELDVLIRTHLGAQILSTARTLPSIEFLEIVVTELGFQPGSGASCGDLEVALVLVGEKKNELGLKPVISSQTDSDDRARFLPQDFIIFARSLPKALAVDDRSR